MTKKVCGYTGKGLRINLTTQEVKVEATFPRFKDDIGGTAIGYKVFWEEVDPKTSCYDPENKLVIAPGPLSGTGAICSGRTAITTLWPTAYPQSLISSAHVGGELAHKLKFAGWDFVIIEGESAKPIYLYINNDKVEFRDASAIWGQGTYRSASMLAQETRPDVSIGTIGPAGENGVPMSNMMVDRSHSAGGIGSIMGKRSSRLSLSGATVPCTLRQARSNGKSSWINTAASWALILSPSFRVIPLRCMSTTRPRAVGRPIRVLSGAQPIRP